MTLPKSIQDLAESFEMLPGIGPKTALRLAFYLLKLPTDDVERFSDSLLGVKTKTKICADCFNVCDSEVCAICENPARDKDVICIVESPLDVIALEKSGFNGVYHVLHGFINPMAGIGPEEIFIPQFFNRLSKLNESGATISEVIIATSTSMEGESTAMYINREISKNYEEIKVSRIGKGLPIGADIEFADEKTLSDAIDGRTKYGPSN